MGRTKDGLRFVIVQLQEVCVHPMLYVGNAAHNSLPNIVKGHVRWIEREVHLGVIKALSDLKWKDKRIRVFQFGDYDALCKLVGLSGAAATYSCYYCLADWEQMQNPRRSRDKDAARALSNIQQDHADLLKKELTLRNRRSTTTLHKRQFKHSCPCNVSTLPTCPNRCCKETPSFFGGCMP